MIFTRCTFSILYLVYVVIQVHALSSTFHGSHINNINPTYTASKNTPHRKSNGLVMRKQKASNKRTARRQRGNVDLSTSSSTTQILNSSPMAKSQWKHKKIETGAAIQAGGRGRARKRLKLYNSLASYHSTFLDLISQEYQMEVRLSHIDI